MDKLGTEPLSLWRQICEDKAHHGHWSRPGFQALAVHRIGVWLKNKPPLTRALIKPIYYLLQYMVRCFFGIELTTTTTVGRRLLITHQGGIVINHNAVLGDDCLISQNVTIGEVPRVRGAPRLGDRVRVGAGAVIVGNITIGNDARIGPNAVIMTDVPEGATALAPAPRIIRNMRFRKKAVAPVNGAAPAGPSLERAEI